MAENPQEKVEDPVGWPEGYSPWNEATPIVPPVINQPIIEEQKPAMPVSAAAPVALKKTPPSGDFFFYHPILRSKVRFNNPKTVHKIVARSLVNHALQKTDTGIFSPEEINKIQDSLSKFNALLAQKAQPFLQDRAAVRNFVLKHYNANIERLLKGNPKAKAYANLLQEVKKTMITGSPIPSYEHEKDIRKFLSKEKGLLKELLQQAFNYNGKFSSPSSAKLQDYLIKNMAIINNQVHKYTSPRFGVKGQALKNIIKQISQKAKAGNEKAALQLNIVKALHKMRAQNAA